MQIVDLHCDLLAYLAHKDVREATNREARCALPQLKEGTVSLQVLAVYTETGEKAVASAEQQFALFQQLPVQFSGEFSQLKKRQVPQTNGVHIIAAIENASGLCGEQEKLDTCFTRFDHYREAAGPILYISMTWNHENRFGGGNFSKVGLKRDGELLLDYLDGKNIAIDLSHTSDALAHDIFDYIDKKGLKIIPIASHSNFRSVVDVPRNLIDPIAKEIANRGGIIGLNFVRPFLGEKVPEAFHGQIDYAHRLGLEEHLCFGADFFYEDDFENYLERKDPAFHEAFGDSSCYPKLLDYLATLYSQEELEKLAYKNFVHFLQRV